MIPINLTEIVKKARENGVGRYDSLAKMTNKDIGHKMIGFTCRTIHARKINDWGRDEDTDRYIGLDSEGWIEYIQTMQCMVGPRQITNENVRRMKDEDIIAFLQSSDCSNKEYLTFMAMANELICSC